MNRAASTFTIALVCATALPARAMTLPPGAASLVTPGTVVRWTALPDSTTAFTGRVVTLSGDALVVADEHNTSVTLAVPALTSLEVSDPTNRAGRYAIVGGLIGGALAVTLKAATLSSPYVALAASDSDKDEFIGPALGGVMVGAAIGGLIGMNVKGRDRWKSIEAGAGVSLLHNGIPAASVAIRF